MTPILQSTFLTIPLSALGCPLYPPFQDGEGNKVRVRVKLLDTVRFMVMRWEQHPEVSIGLPLVAGVPLEEISKVAKDRLKQEYERRKLPWPEQTEGRN